MAIQLKKKKPNQGCSQSYLKSWITILRSVSFDWVNWNSEERLSIWWRCFCKDKRLNLLAAETNEINYRSVGAAISNEAPLVLRRMLDRRVYATRNLFLKEFRWAKIHKIKKKVSTTTCFFSIPVHVFINTRFCLTLQSWRCIALWAYKEVPFFLVKQRTRDVQASVSIRMQYCIYKKRFWI